MNEQRNDEPIIREDQLTEETIANLSNNKGED